MKYISTLLAVRDMKRAINFYTQVLEMEIEDDFGANVVLSGGLCLQTLDTWTGFIDKRADEITLGHNAGELYFEADELDGFAARVQEWGARYVHPIREHSWGQRALRFYAPDGHIIEVGESIDMVVRRFLNSGLSVAETAARMDVSEDYVRSHS